MYVSFTYPYMCCFFSLFKHMFLILVCCFTQRCLDEFCLKCFRNTSCQSLLAINSLYKFFQEFVLGLVTIFTHTLYLFFLYVDVRFFHLPLHVLFLFSLYTHVPYACMQSIISVSHKDDLMSFV